MESESREGSNTGKHHAQVPDEETLLVQGNAGCDPPDLQPEHTFQFMILLVSYALQVRDWGRMVLGQQWREG